MRSASKRSQKQFLEIRCIPNSVMMTDCEVGPLVVYCLIACSTFFCNTWHTTERGREKMPPWTMSSQLFLLHIRLYAMNSKINWIDVWTMDKHWICSIVWSQWRVSSLVEALIFVVSTNVHFSVLTHTDPTRNSSCFGLKIVCFEFDAFKVFGAQKSAHRSRAWACKLIYLVFTPFTLYQTILHTAYVVRTQYAYCIPARNAVLSGKLCEICICIIIIRDEGSAVTPIFVFEIVAESMK